VIHTQFGTEKSIDVEYLQGFTSENMQSEEAFTDYTPTPYMTKGSTAVRESFSVRQS
jgi:hypothetical protein